MNLLITSGSPKYTISQDVTSCFSRCGYHWVTKPQRWQYGAAAFSHRSRRYATTPRKKKISDPLHILFCGSDKFSCASLEALHAEHVRNPDLIQSIDVFVRPTKPTERGMKFFKESPFKTLANSLGLTMHTRDTFTGWTMPAKINLIVAVSFGLFVPHRLLSTAKYGGLNLHPSLLPDLWGPAPLEHTLMLNRPLTGVTLQTLDHINFDNGVILDQTPSDPSDPAALRVPPTSSILASSPPTVADLLNIVSPAGANMLVDGLRSGLHVPPFRSPAPALPPLSTIVNSAGEQETVPSPIVHAHKITKDDRRLTLAIIEDCQARFQSNMLARRHAAIGPLWFISCNRWGQKKRIIIVEMIASPPCDHKDDEPLRKVRMLKPGDPRRRQRRPHDQVLIDPGPVSPQALQAARDRADRIAKGTYTGKSTRDAPRKYFIPFVDHEAPKEEDLLIDQPPMLPHEEAFYHQDRKARQDKIENPPPRSEEQQRIWEEEQERRNLLIKMFGWNLVVRDVFGSTDLQCGNYRFITLKVEGEAAKPARTALRHFYFGQHTLANKMDILAQQTEKAAASKPTVS